MQFLFLYIVYFLSALQEAQDIFGVDFDYDDFEKYGEYEDEEEEEEDEDYIDDDGLEGEKRTKPKKAARKKPAKKSIFEIYEPTELKRGHFTDLDNEVINQFKLELIFFFFFFILFKY